MRYLLDTHVALWALDDSTKLSATAKRILKDTSIETAISIVSAWEVAIKVSMGKLKFQGGSFVLISRLTQSGIQLLDISPKQLRLLETLPFIHRDPFDRMLVATAISENMNIITADENIHRYDVACVW